MEELLTVEELSKKLKVSIPHIYSLKAQHKIPFVKVGESLRFRPSEIETWLNKTAVEARGLADGHNHLQQQKKPLPDTYR